MFKINKLKVMTIVAMVLLPVTMVYGQTIASIDKNQLNNGILNISYQSPDNKAAKVLIAKGTTKYTYDLKSNGQYPLQSGDGDYTVSVLENASGNQYKVVKSETISLKKTDVNAVYLQSIQMINWSNDMKATKKAKEITKNAQSDLEKATIIYNYVANNVKYDFNKARSVSAGYVPTIDQTLETSLGICYDYSALYAAMMRSVGVPTKLVMGDNTDIKDYHAWNEVYLQDRNQWVIIDTTYDAPSVQAGIPMEMIKDTKNYAVKKQY